MRFQIGQNNQNYTEAYSEVSPIYSVRDATLNSSSKTFTVPDGEMWHLNWVRATFTSTATAGNRTIELDIIDESSNVFLSLTAGAVQAASTTVDYNFLQGIYRETTVINGELQVPFGLDTWLPAGWSMKIFDSAAIDAAADDMIVSFQVKRYKGA